MNTIRLNGLRLTLDETEKFLAARAAGALGINANDILSLEVIHKALDARRNRPPHFVYAVKICMADTAMLSETLSDGLQILPFHDEPDIEPASAGPSDVARRQGWPGAPGVEKLPVVVVGSGPAGLFAAYTLAVAGVPVLLMERGRLIEKRVEDVIKFWEEGVLQPQSNVLFGEGGAGTFSDGKLTSRTKNPYAGMVKKVLVEAGATPAILTDAKPHIGTDKLRQVIIRMRKKLEAMGCVLQFESQVRIL
jgi:uncharacterized FAD-dependent dehydrogenase